MQALGILTFVTILAFVITGGWVLPAISLHFALSQETLLHEQARSIIETNRRQQATLSSELELLTIPGILINSVSSNTQGDYLIYQINFEHTGLFIEDDQPRRTMKIVADLV